MARKLEVQIVGDARQYERSLQRAARDTTRFDRQISKTFRGAAAGSGVFKTLGRSLAFASGGFIAAAGVTDLLRGSIEQASEAAATQKQLAAQFKASGQNIELYRAQIDEATNAVSRLAGFEDDQLTRAFTTAFRGSENVSVALKIQATAADVARARHIDLQTATLALTKAYGGQSAALKRLGVLIPANLHGMAALNFVTEKFAGQAAAGTTAQDRFSAAFANFEEVVGTALLPTFDKLLTSAANWLSDTKNQEKVQADIEKVVRTSAKAFGLLAGAIEKTADAYDKLSKHKGPSLRDLTGKLPGGNRSLLDILGITGGGPKIKPISQPGATADRQFGRSPLGAGGPAEVAAAAARAALVAASKRHASLSFQISLALEAIAKAELTASQKDDRAMLVRLAALTREKIAKTRDLGQRTQLYQSLGSIEEQIRSIDEKGAADRQADRQKELDARKKAAEAAVRHAEKIKALQVRAEAQQTAAQFRQLGFGPGGADLIPSGRELLKRLGKIRDQVKGTVLDTGENRKLLARIRETLVGGLGKLAPEVRSKIDELLDALDIEKAAKKKRKARLSPLEEFIRGGGLGTTISSGLTRLGTPIGVPVPKEFRPNALNVQRMEVNIYGVQNVREFENELAKRTKARPHPRRG